MRGNKPVPDRVNVLHVRDSSGIFGAERVILTLWRNIDAARFNLTLLAMRRADGRSQGLITAAERCRLPGIPLDIGRRLELGAIRAMRREVRARGIDIVHAHDFKSAFYALAASARLPVKRVVTEHGSTRDSLRKRLYLRLNEHVIYRFFHRVIAVSEDLGAALERRRIRPPRLATIPNGIDVELLGDLRETTPAEHPLPLRPGHLVFAVVGRLFPDKGHRFFLQALARLRQTHPAIDGLIIGDGPGREAIAGFIEALGLKDSACLCGFRADMQAVYGSIDCLVVPSLREGVPYAVLEAMAAGVPVIASAVGDIPRLIEDGVSGRLVPAGDVGALHAALLDFVEAPARARSLAGAAKQLISEKWSARQMAEATQALYLALRPGESAPSLDQPTWSSRT